MPVINKEQWKAAFPNKQMDAKLAASKLDAIKDPVEREKSYNNLRAYMKDNNISTAYFDRPIGSGNNYYGPTFGDKYKLDADIAREKQVKKDEVARVDVALGQATPEQQASYFDRAVRKLVEYDQIDSNGMGSLDINKVPEAQYIVDYFSKITTKKDWDAAIKRFEELVK